MKLNNKLNFYTIILLTLVLMISCSDETPVVPHQEASFCDKIHRTDTFSLSKQLAPFEAQMKDKTGVYVLEDGGGAMVMRAWMCEAAESTIDIQYFIFSTDNVGLIACDYLVRAADRGVKVRLIVDDIMIEAEMDDVLVLAAHPNIDIKIYNTGVNLGKNFLQKVKKFTTEFRSANQRMHNKTFIVDGMAAITGGRNIADEYFDYDHEYNFRDRDVLLIGQVTRDINTSFEQFWTSDLSVDINTLAKVGDTPRDTLYPFNNLHEYACNPDNFWPQVRDRIQNFGETIEYFKSNGGLVWVDSVDFVSDMPGKNDGKSGLGGGGLSTTALIKLVQNAKHSVDIQSPYLITSDLSRSLFKKATDRGVKIRILTNSLASTDNLEAFSNYQSNRDKLLATGVQVYEFKPDAAVRKAIMTGDLHTKDQPTPIFGHHAKSMVVDGEIAMIGTFNLDPRSANLNTECIAVIYSKEVAQNVLNGMNIEFQSENAWEITKDFNPDKTVGKRKRFKSWTRKILPQNIL